MIETRDKNILQANNWYNKYKKNFCYNRNSIGENKNKLFFQFKKKEKNYKSIRYILSRFLKLLEQSKTISLKKIISFSQN